MQMSSRQANWMVTFSALSATFIWCIERAFQNMIPELVSRVKWLDFLSLHTESPLLAIHSCAAEEHSQLHIGLTHLHLLQKKKKTELHYKLFLSFFLFILFFSLLSLYFTLPRWSSRLSVVCTLKSWRERCCVLNCLFPLVCFKAAQFIADPLLCGALISRWETSQIMHCCFALNGGDDSFLRTSFLSFYGEGLGLVISILVQYFVVCGCTFYRSMQVWNTPFVSSKLLWHTAEDEPPRCSLAIFSTASSDGHRELIHTAKAAVSEAALVKRIDNACHIKLHSSVTVMYNSWIIQSRIYGDVSFKNCLK